MSSQTNLRIKIDFDEFSIGIPDDKRFVQISLWDRTNILGPVSINLIFIPAEKVAIQLNSKSGFQLSLIKPKPKQ